MKRLTSLLLAALLLLPSLCGCSPQSRLDDLFSRYNFSGVARAVKDGEVVCEKAAGTANYSDKENITLDSLFCVGSVSKQFAAASVLILRDRGLLQVDDLLGEYYPDCVYGGEVTLKNMLTQRSGIAEFYEVEDENGSYNELPVGELRGALTNENTAGENRETLTDWLLAQPLGFEPGSRYEYTNSNYFLLTGVVELVSKMSYEDFVKNNILKPLGMENTGFIDEMLSSDRLAQSPANPKTVYVGITRGLGDLISNAADMELWADNYFDYKILSKESIDEMTANYCAADEGVTYGYGVKTDSRGGIFHTGFFTSYCAVLYVNPKTRGSFFAVTNDKTTVHENIKTMFWEVIRDTM